MTKNNTFSVGERVFYKTEFNNPGYYKPGDMLEGVIICTFANPTEPTYQIKLDMKWGEYREGYEGRMLHKKMGRHIIVGGVKERSISRNNNTEKVKQKNINNEILPVRLVFVKC